ncbi:MAG: maleylacetoacetate isomerase [Pseudomonadota bacterium]|nr:maleylacetoacetate isomerase [Pseudomonadota bacterium]
MVRKPGDEIVLHSYFRSSTSFRVRAALNLKGLSYTYVAHSLLEGAHKQARFLAINPQGLVPSIVWDDGTVLSQSLAIVEFIDEVAPEPPLLPGDPQGRARVRSLAQMIACDIHPVNNLRILNALRSRFGASDGDVSDWFRHWVGETFVPLEALLAGSDATGRFCHGDSPGVADLCLAGQVINNARFDVDMAPYPTINRIFDNCMSIEAIGNAAPANQPDAP